MSRTTGLDPSSQGHLIDFLLQWAKDDKCLIFSTQDLDIVEEIATRVIVMGKEHNVMADGQPEDFLFNPDFLVKTNLVHEHSHRHNNWCTPISTCMSTIMKLRAERCLLIT